MTCTVWPAEHYLLPEETKARYFVERLREMLEDTCLLDIDKQTEGDEVTFFCPFFQLDIALVGNNLIVTDIMVRKRRQGIGRLVMNTVHQYCAENHLEPIAREVEPTIEAESFWTSLGYAPDGTGNYIREDVFADAA